VRLNSKLRFSCWAVREAFGVRFYKSRGFCGLAMEFPAPLVGRFVLPVTESQEKGWLSSFLISVERGRAEQSGAPECGFEAGGCAEGNSDAPSIRQGPAWHCSRGPVAADAGRVVVIGGFAVQVFISTGNATRGFSGSLGRTFPGALAFVSRSGVLDRAFSSASRGGVCRGCARWIAESGRAGCSNEGRCSPGPLVPAER